MPFRFKTVKVNLVEDARWKWGDEESGWASDNAYDAWDRLSNHDCGDLVDDLVEAAIPQPLALTYEEHERVCEELLRGTADTLESVRRAILDSLTWAWELAYTPTAADGEDALTKAKDAAEIDLDGEHWELFLEHPPPALEIRAPSFTARKYWQEVDVIGALLNEVNYVQKEGWHDRFLVFSFGYAQPVQDLMAAADKIGPEELERVRGWLERDFEDWQNKILRRFFEKLVREMKASDPGNRVDFRKQWKSMLEDQQTMEAVRKELTKFLRVGRKEWKPPKS